MTQVKNRWFIAASAVGIHISIGSVYAWSVFSKPLMEEFGWSLKEVGFTFGLAIFFLGISAAFMGHFVEKHGPRKAGLVAAALFGSGLIGSGLAVQMESLYLLYAFYGVLGGMGLGVGYVAPVSTLVKWFPDRRGLATGMAIMGFGFAAAIAGPSIRYLIANMSIAAAFYILGSVYLCVMVLASLYLAPPPKDWLPESMKGDVVKKASIKVVKDLSQLTANESIKTPRFYFLWVMLYINVTCGIAVISVASPMAMEVAGMDAVAAASMVGLMGLCNGFGRIGWATCSDYIGRPLTYVTFFVLQIFAFFALPHVSSAMFFQCLVLLILTCYGGGFSSIPAFIGDIFGTKQLGAIHGYILTAWAAAGLSGSTLMAMVKEQTGSYQSALYVFCGLFVVALTVSILMIINIRSIRNATEETSETV